MRRRTLKSCESGPEVGKPPSTWPPFSSRPVPPAAATPSRPRRAVVTLPQRVICRPPKFPQPHHPKTTRPSYLRNLFEEDEDQTQEGRRREKLSAAPSYCASSTHPFPKLPVWLCSLASAGCWRALLRTPGVVCLVSRTISPFGRARKSRGSPFDFQFRSAVG